MPTRHRRRDIKPDRIRALELLASCDNGCPEGILYAHGFAISDMVELVHAGLAKASAERVIAGSRCRGSLSSRRPARHRIAPGCGRAANGDIKRAAHGYEPTREAAMAAFAKSWRRQ
jgi:hypothetical protein